MATEKKTAAKTTKAAATKTTTKKATTKTETKAVETKAAEVKAETKAAEKKPAAKKTTTTKKTTTKKVAAKVEMFIEFGGVQVSVDEIVENVKKVNGKDAKNYTIYLKPEDSKAYFVADGEEKEMDVYFA
ncbi:MAG: hypothetical protein IJA62_01255 [Ruminococcus sp.]|nr:hypothetical protein [Ruminococcus sp.]